MKEEDKYYVEGEPERYCKFCKKYIGKTINLGLPICNDCAEIRKKEMERKRKILLNVDSSIHVRNLDYAIWRLVGRRPTEKEVSEIIDLVKYYLSEDKGE